MEYIIDYVYLELAILIPVLYFIGAGIKLKFPQVKNAIPLILMVCGVMLAMLWVKGNGGYGLNAIFVAVTQGIICAGLAVYGHEILKKRKATDYDVEKANEGR